MSGNDIRKERNYFIDWIRIFAFGLLIIYHVGMYYVSWPWHIKSQTIVMGLEPWMSVINPWRMDLLFIVSGFASLAMFQKTGQMRKFLVQRFTRIMIPLVFGVLVIIPPQTYFEVIEKFSYQGSYLQFLNHYYGGGGSQFCDSQMKCVVMPTWNHLWYLPYLLTYTVCAAFLATVPRQFWQVVLKKVDAAARPYWLITIPTLYLALTRIALRDSYPPTYALIGDWFQHSQYFFMFLCGAYLYKSHQLLARLASVRQVALLSAVVFYLVFKQLINLDDQDLLPIVRLDYSAMQWCTILAIFGYASVYLNHGNRTLRYLTDAIFPIYILHQTITILLAKSIQSFSLDLWLEVLLLVAGTWILCLLGYESIRRFNLLRPLFGLKSLQTTPS